MNILFTGTVVLCSTYERYLTSRSNGSTPIRYSPDVPACVTGMRKTSNHNIPAILYQAAKHQPISTSSCCSVHAIDCVDIWI